MTGNRRGQVTAEMAVLFAFVIAAFVFMGIYMQRGVQGSTKSNADQLGQQFSTEKTFSAYNRSQNNEVKNVTKTAGCSKYVHDLASVADLGDQTCTPSVAAASVSIP